MISIRNCSAEEYIKTLADNSLDLIFVDPPYEIKYLDLDWDKQGNIHWDKLISEFNRILKPNGQFIIMTGWSTYPRLVEIITDSGTISHQNFYHKNSIVWDRIKGRGCKTNLVGTREELLWFVKNPKKYIFNKIPSTIKKVTRGLKSNSDYRAISNVWTDISPLVPWGVEKKLYYHPTQKPYKLVERVINIWSNKGDTVGDFFMGTGVTAEVCKNLDRNFMGCEIKKEYFDKVELRIGN